MRQNLKSVVCLSTSTPNEFITNICGKYDIELFINTGEKGIAADWNFAYSCVLDKKLITLAHQDDCYEPDYLETIIELANKANNPLIIHTNYYEIRNGVKIISNTMLRVKCIMNFLPRFSVFWRSKAVRRFILSFGNPILCPSVTIVSANVKVPPFDTGFKNNMDYKAWINLSQLNGEFVYSSKKLVGHRIHKGSATSANIADNSRSKEDIEILSEFWPKTLVKIIFSVYTRAEKSNRL
jgi:hypothetical protein